MRGVQRRLEFSRRRGRADQNAPKFAEFFAGIGLMRMGLEAAGWRIAFANDIDPKKHAQYAHQFEDADEHFVVGDIHALRAADIPSVDLATASFPCTDLSLAGGRRGLRSGESSAFWGFRDILARMGTRRPPLVLLENVTGFLSSNDGEDFASAMLAMNELGYAVDPLFIDARWFVPQSRPRLFVVARLDAAGAAGNCEASGSRLRPKAVCDFISRHPDIRWGIGQWPQPPADSGRRLPDILENLAPDSPEWWSRERVEYLYGQMSDRHRRVADDMRRRRAWSYGTVFRRVRKQPDGVRRSMAELRTDGIAGCLRTPKGGSGRQILFKAGYGKMAARLLTPRECARLMGADEFAVSGSLNDALFGFGDAVCVPAITWIATHILWPLLARPISEAS